MKQKIFVADWSVNCNKLLRTIVQRKMVVPVTETVIRQKYFSMILFPIFEERYDTEILPSSLTPDCLFFSLTVFFDDRNSFLKDIDSTVEQYCEY